MGIDVAAAPELQGQKELIVTVEGREYVAVIRQIPFREGVELSCFIDDEEIRVSDRGLGDHEAIRLLEEEIRLYVTEGYSKGTRE